MKMRREHKAPLPRQAITILKNLHEITGEGRAGLVFPSVRSVMRPISENTLNAALRRMGYAKEEVSAHGFRATARTLIDEAGAFRPEVIEAALAHVKKDAVQKAYDRATYFPERKLMAQWWADYLDSLKAQKPNG